MTSSPPRGTTSAPLHELLGKLDVETKLADGAEHLLSLLANDATQEPLRQRAEDELKGANQRIGDLEKAIADVKAQDHDASNHLTTPSPAVPRSALGLESYSMTRTIDSTPTWTLSPPLSRRDAPGSRDYVNMSPSGTGRSHTIDSPPSWHQPSDHTSTPSLAKDGAVLRRQASMLIQSLRVTGENGSTFSPHASSSRNGVLDADALPQTREGITRNRLDTISRLVSLLKKKTRLRYDLDPEDLSAAVFPCLAESAGTESRAAAYSLLRNALVSPANRQLSIWHHNGLDLYLIRSIMRDNRHIVEKEQALKLIRAIMDAQYAGDFGGVNSLHQDLCLNTAVVRAMVAAAEHSDDKMKNIFLETLVELAVYNLTLLLQAGGLATLLHALWDGPFDLAPAIAQVLLFLVDKPSTRLYLRPELDLEFVLSGFTDLPAQAGISYSETLLATSRVVGTLLRSWTGLLYLSMHNRKAIISLVTAMRVGQSEVQEAIIGMLISIFDLGLGMERQRQRAKAREHSDLPEQDALEGKIPQSRIAQEISRIARERNRQKIGLLDQYMCLLLVIFIDSGLIEALVHILETASEMSRSATLLLGALFQVGTRVLPQSYNVHIHQLPSLFAGASRLDDPDGRRKAVRALSAVDRASLLLQNQYQSSAKSTARDRSDSTSDDPLRRGQRQVEKVKLLMGMQIDEVAFRNLILETQVQSTRDHTKWNTDGIFELLQGPLLNPRRLEEAIRLTKLMRRLLGFFHPFALLFSDLPATPPNRIYITLGCTLLTTLLSTPEGIKFLTEDGLLREIKEAFDEIDPTVGGTASDPILAKSRITSTLSQGYLEMIGTLSATTEGSKLLSRFHIWTSLYRLCHLRARDDLIKVLIEKLDYTLNGHPRILLGWVLTSGNRPLRKSATEFLARLIRRKPNPGEWMISFLLTQLCDPVSSVRDIAVAVVKEVCSSTQTLEMVVSLRPTLDHLGETGHELLLRFLSTPGGLRYLLEGDYIDREMDEWFNERNHRYAVTMEVNLNSALNVDRPSKDDSDLEAEFDGTTPPHFYGELAKTPEGCEVLREKGHFLEFADFIRHNGMEDSDLEILGKLKSILWTVACIGASPGGFPFLEEEGTVADIVDIAESSPVLSIRGTCFYVIGLISTTRRGAELLQDYGWQSACTTFGMPIGICIPERLADFAQLPSWDMLPISSGDTFSRLIPPTDPVQRSILTSISNLGNSILANKSSKTLSKLKHRHQSAFSDLSLFVRAVELMNSFKFRAVIRKYIWECFNVELDQETVKEIRVIRAELSYPLDEGKGAPSLSRKGVPSLPTIDDLPNLPEFAPKSDGAASEVMQARRASALLASSSHRFAPHSLRHVDLEPPNPLEDAAMTDADGEDFAADLMDEEEEEEEEEEEAEEEAEAEDEDEGNEEDELADHHGLATGEADYQEYGAGEENFDDTIEASTITRAPPFTTTTKSRKQSLMTTRGGGGGGAATSAYLTGPGPGSTRQSILFIDGFGERRGEGWSEPAKLSPAPGVRLIGGFGDAANSSSKRGSRRMSWMGME